MIVDPERLSAIDEELARYALPTGTGAGALLEERGDLLLLGTLLALDDASEAFEKAAAAYSQSPEASMAPVERSRRASDKAGRVRALFDEAAGLVSDMPRLLERSRELVEKRALLARVEAAITSLSLDPDENAFELAKAIRDRDATRERLAEIVRELRTLVLP